jgi:hypothetical protein
MEDYVYKTTTARSPIVKLVRTPYSNYEAFLASVETWLIPDNGVFDFLITGTPLELPIEAVKKLMADREAAAPPGVPTRSSTLLHMYYQSEINKIQRKHED